MIENKAPIDSSFGYVQQPLSTWNLGVSRHLYQLHTIPLHFRLRKQLQKKILSKTQTGRNEVRIRTKIKSQQIWVFGQPRRWAAI